MMWLLANTWNRRIVFQKRFIHKLFVSPRHVIDWELYPGATAFSTKEYDHVPPTICIYDVKKKVKGMGVDDRYINSVDDDDCNDDPNAIYCCPGNVEVEVKMLSDYIAGAKSTEDPFSAKILRNPSIEKISNEVALQILCSGHKFTVEDAGRFVTLFDRPARLPPDERVKYYLLKDIRNIYGPKPDTVCLDPDDSNTFKHFGNRIFEIYPIRDQFYHCGRPLIGDPVFEVFSITIRELGPNRNFSLIHMKSDASSDIPLIIYKLPEGKEVDIGKPLPLKARFRLPTPNSDVIISFTTHNTTEASWYFVHEGLYFTRYCLCHYGKNLYDNVVTSERCTDRRNTSIATIKYRISLSALRAELAFTFFGELYQTITITDGYIVATDDGDLRTKRVIQEYYEETPVCLRSGQRLQVDRCVLGVPTGSYLRVEVKLVYFVATSPDKTRTIEGYHDFTMPEYVSTQGLTFSASDGSTSRLCVECFWTGDN